MLSRALCLLGGSFSLLFASVSGLFFFFFFFTNIKAEQDALSFQDVGQDEEEEVPDDDDVLEFDS